MRTPRMWLVIAATIALVGAASILRGQWADAAAVASALQDALTRKPKAVSAIVWAEVRRFYEHRGGSPAWVGGRDAGRAEEILELLRRAPEHGLATTSYEEPQLAAIAQRVKQNGTDVKRAQQLAELDARLTAAALALGHDVAFGRTAPERLDARWKSRREAFDLPASLNQFAERGLGGWLDALKPAHPEYAALQKALEHLRGSQENGGWPKIPAASLRPGSSGPAVAAMRGRLAASGDLQSDAWTSDLYDAELEAAVRSLQDRHGLKPTGVADAATVAAMNVSIGARIHQVALNLERWRWIAGDLGPRHILVNIPAYELVIREDGRTAMSMRVVVGQPSPQRRTPIFSATMTTVVFSPYWNIPDTIAEGEVAPEAAHDPEYLARNSIDLLRVSKAGTEVIDPASVNWHDPEEVKQLAFRQRPGSANALGHVKFLLPNRFGVYLHDTPADHLFARAGRALSHGCIRLQQPEALARYVLRDQPEWDERRILAAMSAGVETPVRLTQPLPVHIMYFTASADEEGGLHFFPDVYRFDR